MTYSHPLRFKWQRQLLWNKLKQLFAKIALYLLVIFSALFCLFLTVLSMALVALYA